MVTSDYVHVEASHSAIEVAANHLLAITSHDTLTRGEVLGSKDGGSDNEWNVGSVDVTGLQVAAALEADEDLVAGEVRILVDGEAVAEGSDLLGANGHGGTDLTAAIDGVDGLVEHRSLQDGGDIGGDHDEVG